MRCLPLLCLVLLLTGCFGQNPADALLEDYLARLARVLRQPEPEVARQSPPKLPAVRDLFIDYDPPSIDLLDFWAFRQCGLAPILGERNSVLGRVMRPSQALHMDGRVLRQLADCEQQLKDKELLQLTRQLRTQKIGQWPLSYWNATIASPELRQFWSPASEPLGLAGQQSFTAAQSALMFLADLPRRIAGDDWPSLQVMEGHYQQLDSHELGGRLLRSLQLASDYLRSANDLLTQAATQHSLCPNGLQRRELIYARNVMSNVFAGQVQPWLALLNREASGLLPLYDRLIDEQSYPLRIRIQPFQKSIHQLLEDFSRLNRQHVLLWQTLFENCGSQAIPSEGNKKANLPADPAPMGALFIE